MSDEAARARLLELFRQEGMAHAAALEEGVDALAHGAELGPPRGPALAYAAGAIQTAARIVGLDGVAAVGRALERLFSEPPPALAAAPEATAPLLGAAVRLLREAAEAAPSSLPDWLAGSGERLREAVRQLDALGRGEAAASSKVAGAAAPGAPLSVAPSPVTFGLAPAPSPASAALRGTVQFGEPPSPSLDSEATAAAAASSTPASPASSPWTSTASGAVSLFELFRLEAETHAATLSQGILALERDSGQGDLLHQLMRAAHSIKGAARIVGVEPAVALAHAMEDLFIAVIDGKLELGDRSFDQLLRGADAILRLARAGTEAPAAARALAAELCAELRALGTAGAKAGTPLGAGARDPARARGLAQEAAGVADRRSSEAGDGARGEAAARGAGGGGGTSPAAMQRQPESRSAATQHQPASQSAPVSRAAPPPFEPSAAAVPARAPAPPDPAAAPGATPGAESPERPAEGGTASADRSGPKEPPRTVRVAAPRIDRMMSLSGEALVESRRLEPLADNLRKLALRQRALVERLTELQRVVDTPGDDASARAALAAEAKAIASECRLELGARLGELDAYARRAEDLTSRLYHEAVACRMRPFGDGLQGFPRLVRDISRKLQKQVELTVVGEGVGVDRDILEKLEAPLNHMIRNAVDHGLEGPAERRAAAKPERGHLRLEARHWAGMLRLTVSDDGRGVDPKRVRARVAQRGLLSQAAAAALSDAEALDYVFVPGFSTAEQVTEISGRGVGLDVVRSVVQELGGTVHLSSELGRGTAFHLQLPITLSVLRAVVVEIAGDSFAFPMTRIDRLLEARARDLATLEGQPYLVVEGKNVGLVDAHAALGLAARQGAAVDPLSVVVLADRTRLFGVTVDRFVGELDLVVRPLDPRLGKVADVVAAALLPDGTPVLIVDVEDLLRSVHRKLDPARAAAAADAADPATRRRRLLVVDDSITVREVQRQVLANAGYDVEVAVDGLDGWHMLRARDFDLIVTDVDMPRMSGIELVRSVKKDPRLRDMPVLIVSYKDREEDRRHGLEAGADRYLAKSDFSHESLLGAVEELVGGAR